MFANLQLPRDYILLFSEIRNVTRKFDKMSNKATMPNIYRLPMLLNVTMFDLTNYRCGMKMLCGALFRLVASDETAYSSTLHLARMYVVQSLLVQ